MSGQGETKTHYSCNLPNFPAKILPDVIQRANQLHAHPYQYLLTYAEGVDDNQWFWIAHLAHVSHSLGQMSGQGETKTHYSCDLPNFPAKILPDAIQRANQLHAHLCQYLSTYAENDNQWFWVAHLAHVGHAGSDLWIGCDKKSSAVTCPTFKLKLKSSQMSSKEPINSMLILANIS
jgi:hypothetical protein